MPDVGFSLFGHRISLNPDRNFNQKEHMLATIMANTGFSTPYTSNIILTQFLPQYCESPFSPLTLKCDQMADIAQTTKATLLRSPTRS